MHFIGTVIEKLQRHPKRIVFPEGTEPRVLQAARQFHCLRLGAPILLGQRIRIEALAAELNIPLDGIRLINPEESPDLDGFARTFRLLRRPRGMKSMEAREALLNPNYFGAMMVAMHQADGLVTGTNVATTLVLRPLIQTIRLAPHISTAAGCTVLEFNHAPSAATQTALLATTHGTTPAELAAWFNRGERGFVINTPDNAAAGTALALALADGAEILPH